MHRTATALILTLAAPMASLAQDLPAPIQTHTDALFAECSDVGGTPSLADGYLTEADLNGDGAPDYITDVAGLFCENAISYFCGSGGCPVTVWLSGPDGLTDDWAGLVQAWELDGTSLRTILHGAFCPGSDSGADGCEEVVNFGS